MSEWSRPFVVRSLTDVQEIDIDDDRDVFLERLGMVLNEARKWASFKQDEAAQRLNMNAATLGRWEHGANKISAYDLVRLVRLYKFDARLAVSPPATRGAIRRALGPKPPRPMLVPTPEEQAFAAQIQSDSIVAATELDQHLPNAEPPTPRKSRRSSVPAKPR